MMCALIYGFGSVASLHCLSYSSRPRDGFLILRDLGMDAFWLQAWHFIPTFEGLYGQ